MCEHQDTCTKGQEREVKADIVIIDGYLKATPKNDLSLCAEYWLNRAQELQAELEQAKAENAALGKLVVIIKALTTTGAEYAVRVRKLKAVVEAAEELLEVAELRGDNDLPHPADDPKLWTARMQDAWGELEQTLAVLEPPEITP